jgi:protein O-GlcNAc transferase
MGRGAFDQQPSRKDAFHALAKEAERRALEERENAQARALAAIAEDDGDPAACIAAARRSKQLGRLKETLAILERGITRCVPSPALHEYYIERLEKCNRTEQAIAAATRAALLFPDHVIFKLREALLLPILYDTPEQLDYYRIRFTEGLQRVTSEVWPDSSTESQYALAALGNHVNKYLGYQGRDDRDLQMFYGKWAHEVMAANFPQWTQRLPTPPVPADGRLRIGYASARFRDVSLTRAFLGWLREHNPTRISVFGYHLSQRTDAATERVRKACESFQQLPHSLEEAAQALVADKLHVLVFLDIGMEPLMTQLAALRLASIQCAAWDHPVTSGLPTIDYFISGDLTEPEDAQNQYSEVLVRLPGIGLCCPKPIIPALRQDTRPHWGLREDAVVYLSCQSIFKYLPSQDLLFAQIAKCVPNSQFVFLVTNELVGEDFGTRLDRAFSAMGLQASDHCVLLPEMPRVDFGSLLQCSDVCLDTIGWSGGVSTFDVVAAELPIVTMPGNFMRGRQSAAILTQLGVIDTIARCEAEYVEIAVRLGLDREWRRGVINRMLAGHPKLFSDTRSVRALEQFYRRVVEERLRSQAGKAAILDRQTQRPE